MLDEKNGAMKTFLEKMEAVLECPVSCETRFRETEDWSSLKAFGILVTLENDFGRRMTVDEFLTMDTLGELARACGVL